MRKSQVQAVSHQKPRVKRDFRCFQRPQGGPEHRETSVPALPLTSCVMWDELLHLSDLQLSRGKLKAGARSPRYGGFLDPR